MLLKHGAAVMTALFGGGLQAACPPCVLPAEGGPEGSSAEKGISQQCLRDSRDHENVCSGTPLFRRPLAVPTRLLPARRSADGAEADICLEAEEEPRGSLWGKLLP